MNVYLSGITRKKTYAGQKRLECTLHVISDILCLSKEKKWFVLIHMKSVSVGKKSESGIYELYKREIKQENSYLLKRERRQHWFDMKAADRGKSRLRWIECRQSTTKFTA